MASSQKRATVYFDPKIHRALRLKSVETEQSVSEIVNDAVRLALAEDAEDLETLERRSTEPRLSFAAVVTKLKRRGKI